MNEFPEFINENELPELPPHVAAIVGQMFSREKEPDVSEFEWVNVVESIDGEDRESKLANIKVEIRSFLAEGYGWNQKFVIKEGVFYWQGARLKKSEGEL